MPTRKLTFLAGGSLAALILGLGMASLALAPVRSALSTAPMRGPAPGAFQTTAPTALGSPSAPIEVASLAGARLPTTAPATPLDAPPAPAGAARVASSDQPRIDPDAESTGDDGPRTVAAPSDPSEAAPWRSPYERHREPRWRPDDAPRFVQAPPPPLEYPRDPD